MYEVGDQLAKYLSDENWKLERPWRTVGPEASSGPAQPKRLATHPSILHLAVCLFDFLGIQETDILPLRLEFLSWVLETQPVPCASFKGGQKLPGTD